MARPGERFGNQRIEEAGADSADDAQQNAFAGSCAAARHAFVGQGIKHNRDTNQPDATEDEHRIAGGGDNIVEPRSQHQRKAGADGKGDRHSSHRDRRDDENVAYTEDRSPGERQPQTAGAGGLAD